MFASLDICLVCGIGYLQRGSAHLGELLHVFPSFLFILSFFGRLFLFILSKTGVLFLFILSFFRYLYLFILSKSCIFARRCDLYYWENVVNGTSSEIDYVIVRNMKVMPIECKAGTSGKMKSLRLFMRNKHLNDAYRCSLENFSILENQDVQDDNAVRRIAINPLYAISNLCK